MTSIDAVLAGWAAFPVDISPRPIVVLDSRVRIGAKGFVNEPAKEAFLAGAFDVDVALPAGVRELIAPEPGRTSHAPLRITAVKQVAASFRTDRGTRAGLRGDGHRPAPALSDARAQSWHDHSPGTVDRRASPRYPSCLSKAG
jgi:hypothetical protein